MISSTIDAVVPCYKMAIMMSKDVHVNCLGADLDRVYVDNNVLTLILRDAKHVTVNNSVIHILYAPSGGDIQVWPSCAASAVVQMDDVIYIFMSAD